MNVIIAGALALFGGFTSSKTNCSPQSMSEVSADGFKVEWRDYAPSKKSLKPTVMILPPTGGTTILDRAFAGALCRRGRHVVIAERWTDFDEVAFDFDLHNRFFGRASRALTMIAERYPGPVHIIGTSVGALFGISALVRIPSVDRAVLIVGGVPFTEVIARSDTKDMIRLREERRKRFGVTGDKDYVDRLNAVFKWNDLDRLSADVLKNKNLLLIMGAEDYGVPTLNQRNFAARFPGAQAIVHDSGHFGTIVKSFFLDFDTIIKFLDN